MNWNRISVLACATSAWIALTFLSEAHAGITCYDKSSYSSNFVSAVQKMLTKAGFTPGPADGKWGSRTERALVAFQQAKHLPATADINSPTLEALFGPGVSAETYGLEKNPHLPPTIFTENCR
jgi:putative peptidoglycan binding protein